jgi:hypothetical protein
LAKAPSAADAFTIRVGRRGAKASPRGSLTPVDFAVGVLGGEAYLGYWQDVDLYSDRGEFIDVDIVPVLIFKGGKAVPYLNEHLKEAGARRAVMPCLMENWWSGKVVDVDPRSYYLDVFSKFKYYIDAPEHALHLFSTWTIGTVFHNLFQAYPYLGLMGAMRSGKTKTLTLIKLMGFNAVRSHSISPATIYRMVESGHVTLLLDEQDYLADPERRSEVRTLLLGGYKKGSYVYRSEKTSSGKIIPTRFSIYSPKALANIEGLEDVLQDRTITTVMMRSVDPKITRREPDENDPSWLELRDRLASLYLHYWREVSSMYGAVLRALGDQEDYSGIPEQCRRQLAAARGFIYSRAREIWSPIIGLALFLESRGAEGVMEAVLKAAEESVVERRSDEVETPEAGLIYALRKIYDGDGWYALADIHAAYKEATGVEKVRPESVGRLMKRLGLKSKKKVAGRVQYYIVKERIEDLARRFGVELEEAQTPTSPAEPPRRPEPLQPPLDLDLLFRSRSPPEGLLAKAIDFAYRRHDKFTLGELALALGASVGEARAVAESLARQGLLIRLDEATFRAAK